MELAYCPLCTAGTGLAALGASYLGIDDIIVGIWVGAFSLSLGILTAKSIKKTFIPWQKAIISLTIFFLTILPSKVFFKKLIPIYLHFVGPYGSILNKTYIINRFLAGSLIGGLIVFISPYINQAFIFLFKGKKIAFQKLIITFTLLALVSLVFYL